MSIEHHWSFLWESEVDGLIHQVSSFLQYLHLAWILWTQ